MDTERVNRTAAVVLVVEDDAAIRRVLATVLTRNGFHTLVAANGDEAHRLLRENQIDLMITDFRLPDMRADQLFHLATALHPHLGRSTIFVTGDITEETENRIANCGGSLLRKPFDLTELMARVREALPGRRTESA